MHTRYRPRVPLLAATLTAILVGIGSPVAVADTARGECALEVLVRQPDGRPAPAGITVETFDAAGRYRGGRTDATGAPVHVAIAVCGEIRVGLERHSSPNGRGEKHLYLASGQTGTVELTSEPLGEVIVQVVDPTGEPVIPRSIDLREIEAPPGRLPDAKLCGRPSCSFAVRAGAYRLSYSDPRRLLSVEINGQDAELPAILHVGAEAIDVRLTVSRRRIIRGRVIDVSGEPQSAMIGTTDRFRSNTEARPDGSFELLVDTLPVQVYAQALDRRFEPAIVQVHDVEDALEFVAHRRPAPGPELEGMVVQEGSEQPVPGVRVILYSVCGRNRTEDPELANVPFEWSAYTDAQGRFSLPCRPECPFTLRIAGRFRRTSFEAQSCDQEPRIALAPRGALDIRVRDEQGRSMDLLPLEFHSKDISGSATPNHKVGNLPAGEYEADINRVRVSPEHAWLVLVAAESSDHSRRRPVATIREAGEVVEWNLLAIPGGSICLRLLAEDPRPHGVLSLSLFTVESKQLVRQRWGRTVQTSPYQFCSFPIPPGTYLVRFDRQNSEPVWWPGGSDPDLAEPVEVRREQITDLESTVISAR